MFVSPSFRYRPAHRMRSYEFCTGNGPRVLPIFFLARALSHFTNQPTCNQTSWARAKIFNITELVQHSVVHVQIVFDYRCQLFVETSPRDQLRMTKKNHRICQIEPEIDICTQTTCKPSETTSTSKRPLPSDQSLDSEEKHEYKRAPHEQNQLSCTSKTYGND